MHEAILSREARKQLHGADYVASFENRNTHRIDRILPHLALPEGGIVADFGCGNAVLMQFVHKRVERYFGVDFSEEFIRAARRRQAEQGISNAEFHCGSIQEFCEDRENFFDAIFAMDLSEHVYDDEWREIVEAMHFSLKTGGKAYLHTPNLDFVIELMKAHDVILKQFPEHIAVRNAEQNAAFFEAAGFADVAVAYLPHYNLLQCLHPLSHLPLVGRHFRARILLSATK